jgi:hypothetical protein
MDPAAHAVAGSPLRAVQLFYPSDEEHSPAAQEKPPPRVTIHSQNRVWNLSPDRFRTEVTSINSNWPEWLPEPEELEEKPVQVRWLDVRYSVYTPVGLCLDRVVSALYTGSEPVPQSPQGPPGELRGPDAEDDPLVLRPVPGEIVSLDPLRVDDQSLLLNPSLKHIRRLEVVELDGNSIGHVQSVDENKGVVSRGIFDFNAIPGTADWERVKPLFSLELRRVKVGGEDLSIRGSRLLSLFGLKGGELAYAVVPVAGGDAAAKSTFYFGDAVKPREGFNFHCDSELCSAVFVEQEDGPHGRNIFVGSLDVKPGRSVVPIRSAVLLARISPTNQPLLFVVPITVIEPDPTISHPSWMRGGGLARVMDILSLVRGTTGGPLSASHLPPHAV